MLCLRNIVDKYFAHVYVYLPSIGENCSIIHSEINVLSTKFCSLLNPKVKTNFITFWSEEGIYKDNTDESLDSLQE